MKDYYNLFVELSLQQCNKNDYANKAKVKAHNAASKLLIQLQEEMKHTVNEEILYKLLNHEDVRVRLNAASFCMQVGVLVKQSIDILRKIIDESDDSTLNFSARMLLQRYSYE